MKIKHLFFYVLAALMMLACEQPQGNLGLPKIELSTKELSFDEAGGEKSLYVKSTREWMVESISQDWVAVSPDKGDASADEQKVTVYVLENKGMDRSVDVVFTIGMSKVTLTVSQSGPGGSADALIVYSNDFDKEKAVKDSDGWKTYLDSFDGWKNATGTAAETVEYAFSGMSARTTDSGHSAGTYSDYDGSGMNYLWFGSGTPYFVVKNITLPSSTDYLLSFGAERNLYNAEDNTFSTEEFKVWVSSDDKKWVELKYAFPNAAPNRRWDLASSKFSVPAGTSKISLAFECSVASSVLFDDLRLVISDEKGTDVDFTAGVDKTFGSSTGGDNPSVEKPDPSTVETITCAQFIEKADESTFYRLVGEVTSSVNTTYCSFDMNDGTGTVVVWTVLNKDEWKDKVKKGGKVTVMGTYKLFNGTKHEMVNAYIEDFVPGEGGDDVGSGDSSEYASTISWTTGNNAYEETAKINGSDAETKILRVGKSKGAGDAVIHLKKGTKKIGFYAVSWNGANTVVTASVGDTVVKTINTKSNSGLAGSDQPYILTVTDEDYFEVDLGAALKADTDVTIKTDETGKRAAFFKITVLE